MRSVPRYVSLLMYSVSPVPIMVSPLRSHWILKLNFDPLRFCSSTLQSFSLGMRLSSPLSFGLQTFMVMAGIEGMPGISMLMVTSHCSSVPCCAWAHWSSSGAASRTPAMQERNVGMVSINMVVGWP